MGLFGKSMEESVNQALEKIRGQFPQANISASVSDKVVTLKGQAPDVATKGAIMNAFNGLVETENTINQIQVPQAAAPAPAAAAPSAPATPLGGPVVGAPTAGATQTAGGRGGPAERIHEVVSGDTLSALAKRYYGNASQYNRIFEANRDKLNDPDKIRVGQKLVIPE